MLLNTGDIKDYEVVEGGEQLGSGEVSIDTSNMGLFYEMMSKSIYSNPIGSIVRELVSNGFDAHIKAIKKGLYPEGTIKPVIVKGYYEEEEYYISFQDFGSGIDEENFHNVYLKYLSSDKRDTNDYMGAMGLGSKSPFSYTLSYYLITRVDGTEWFYIMSKGQNAKPNWDLMYKKETTEPNGTTVKFVIEGFKGGKDWYRFQEEILSQLKYFDDVYIDGFEVDNEYKILEYEYFKFRKDTEEEEMHIALGKVSYPIDWKQLKRPQINIPVGVKFDIGELMITPNRESIRYNDELISIINQRIDLCLKELKSLTKESTYDDLKTLVGILMNPTATIRLDGDVKLPVYEGNYGTNNKGNAVRYPFKVPKPQFTPFAGTPIEVSKHNPFFGFRAIGFINGNGYVSVKDDNTRKLPQGYENVFTLIELKNYIALRTNDFKVNKLKIAYLKDLNSDLLLTPSTKAIIGRNNSIGHVTYLNRLGLAKVAKSPFGKKLMLEVPYIQDGWNKTKLVMLYKKVMTNEIIKRTQSYDRLAIPQEFEKKWREDNKIIRKGATDTEFLGLSMRSYDTTKNESKSVSKISDLKGQLVIYGTNKDKASLYGVYKMLQHKPTLNEYSQGHSKKAIKHRVKYSVLMVNINELKKMEGENYIPIDKFLKHKLLIEQATAYRIYKRFETLELDWATRYIPSVKLWKDKVHKFLKDTIGNDGHKWQTVDIGFIRDWLDIAEEEGLLDKEYLDIVAALEFIKQDLEILKPVGQTVQSFEDEQQLCSFLVAKGYIVNPIYTIKLTEDELHFVNAYIKYNKKAVSHFPETTYKDSLKSLIQEVYDARNNKFSLYTPFTWHKNFPAYGTNKSVKISMLSLEMKT